MGRFARSLVGALCLTVLCVACEGEGDGSEPAIPSGELYVANTGGNSIVGLPLDRTGLVTYPTSRVIQGNLTELHNPWDVAIGPGDEIHVINLGDNSVNGSPSVTVYASEATGNVAPLRVYQGPPFNLSKPNAIAVGNWPGTLVTNHVDPSTPGGFLGVLELSTTVGATEPLTGGIFGGATTITGPSGLARNAGKIYLADAVSDRILGWDAYGSQQNDTAPDVVLGGPLTQQDRPLDLAFDQLGNLYVVNNGSSSITVYPLHVSGNVQPDRRIAGGNTTLSGPSAIAVSRDGLIYVSQGNSVLLFAPGANGNVSPLATISNPALSGTMGLFVRGR